MQRPLGLATALLGIGLMAALAGAEPLAADQEAPELAAPPEFSEGLDLEPRGGPGEQLVLGVEEVPPPVAPAQSKGDGIERAWLAPAGSFEQRVERTRRTSLELGAWNLDPAAHAIAVGGGGGVDPLARAEAAVRLAPDLPAARMRLASARWLHGGNPTGAVLAGVDAMKAIARHLEASLWFTGSALWLLAVALVVGGLLAILVAGLASLRHAAHDVGHLWFGRTPEFARFALLASCLLVPLALGEGFLGLALAVLVVGVIYGTGGQRVALALAAGAVVAGAYPVIQLAASALNAFPADPLARSAFSAASGIASPVDVSRLEAAAARDPLAVRGLAIHARRSGNLGEADALYQKLLRDSPSDPVLLNNAANVRLDLGHMESALELYRRSVEIDESPVVLFNLAQAYGRAFQVEDLNRTLAQAQQRDGELVATLTALQGAKAEGFVVDMPLPSEIMWRRLTSSPHGDAIAAEMRAPLAPGHLGRDLSLAGAASGIAFLLASVFGARFDPTRSCPRCGARMCPRCDGASGGELCDGCTKLFFQPEKTDRNLRLERVNALRDREQRLRRAMAIASVLLPGAAGLLARRPLASFLGTFLFALALAAAFWRGGVVPDPLVAGAAAPFAFLAIAALAGVGYAIVVGTSLARLRS